MRTCGNHLVIVALLSTVPGWTSAFTGRAEAQAGRGQTPVQAPPLQVPADTPSPGNPVVVVATSLGDITLELFKDRAPVSVENFLRYVNDGFYEGTVFHRVKKGFMIQGGGYTADLAEKPTRPPIQNEATNGLRNARGTLAMARRAQLRSATSQFYINVADNRMLDHTGYSPDEFGYAVFGRVLSGMDVVDRIVAVPTKTQGDMEDVPLEPVIIKSVRIVKPAPAP
jgi:cyclophilin family peptidyl-prolyl cis-trans isomerase